MQLWLVVVLNFSPIRAQAMGSHVRDFDKCQDCRRQTFVVSLPCGFDQLIESNTIMLLSLEKI